MGGRATCMIDPQIAINIRQLVSGLGNLCLVLPVLTLACGEPLGQSYALVARALTDGSSIAFLVCSGFAAYFSFMSWYRANAMCGTALAGEYASFSAFTKPRVQEALMTAEKNGLITESRFDLDVEGELRVFYCASLEQRKTISAYLG